MGRTPDRRLLAGIVAANTVPLIGFLFFGWDRWSVVMLYWLEQGVLALWMVPKLLLAAQKPELSSNERPPLYSLVESEQRYPLWTDGPAIYVRAIPFVLILTLVFVFLWLVFAAAIVPGFVSHAVSENPAVVWTVGIGVGVVVLGQGLSFVTDYVRTESYRYQSPHTLLANPFASLFMLLTPLALVVNGLEAAGAGTGGETGTATALVVGLIVFKTALEGVLAAANVGYAEIPESAVSTDVDVDVDVDRS